MHENIHPARDVKNIRGWQIKANGQKNTLDKKHIATVDASQSAGYYDDNHVISATFPDIETGDIIAYEYDIEEKEYWNSCHQTYYFQVDLPVLSSRLIVEIPKGWVLNEMDSYLEPITKSEAGNVYEWYCGYLEYRPSEENMPGVRQVGRCLNYSCYNPESAENNLFGSWEASSRWAMSLFDVAAEPDSSISKVVDSLKSISSSKTELFELIAKFVQTDIRYVAVEIGEGRFQPRKALRTLTNKYGDCKDKSTLMVTMLNIAGFQARSVLASTDDSVKIEFPSPFQFNHAIAAIKMDSSMLSSEYLPSVVDNWLYFDPTHQAVNLGYLPRALHGSNVLPLSDDIREPVTLPSIEPEQYMRICKANASLKADNSLYADILFCDCGQRASITKYILESNSHSDNIERYQEYFADAIKNPRISDFKHTMNNDTCIISFILEGDNYATAAGDLIIFGADVFHTGMKINKIEKDRLFPITFGKVGRYETEVIWRVLYDHIVDDLPDSIDARCRIAGLSSSVLIKDSAIVYTATVSYYGNEMPPSESESAYEFKRSKDAVYNGTIILKKQ